MIRLTLCRFGPSGQLEYGTFDIENTPFFAISHVWRFPEWRKLPNVPRNVLCSEQKAKFICTQLPRLVGTNWFWMDILCVDQAVKAARVAVVRYIPDVFRNASRTIIVREAGGLAACCSNMLNSFLNMQEDPNWFPGMDGPGKQKSAQWLSEDHVTEYHAGDLKDYWMSRLWTLQELELSDTVQFTVCETVDKPTDGKTSTSSPRTSGAQTMMILAEARSVAKIWAGGGRWIWRNKEDYQLALKTHEQQEVAFLNALLHNGTVKRKPDKSEQEIFSISCFDVISQSITSVRETSKARDFVLGVFPRYAWYKVPENVLAMSFEDLFQDCVRQIQAIYALIPEGKPENAHESTNFLRAQDVRPKITKGLVMGTNISPQESHDPNLDVPMPTTLGDFFKLLYHYSSPSVRGVEIPSGSFWKIQDISSDEIIDNILHASSSTIWYASYKLSVWWLQDYARWKERVDMDELVLRLTEMDFLGPELNEDPTDQEHMHTLGDAIRNSLKKEYEIFGPIGCDRVVLEIGNMILSARRGLAQINDIKAKARASGHQSPSNLGLSLEPSWQKLRRTVFEKDTPEFRQAILHIATHVSCGLSMTALPWTRQNLRPYLLILCDSNGPIKDPALARQTLFFAARDLDYDPEDEVIAYDGRNEPYVMTISRKRGDKAPRVIGLLPEVDDYKPEGFHVKLDYGCPVVVPHDDENERR